MQITSLSYQAGIKGQNKVHRNGTVSKKNSFEKYKTTMNSIISFISILIATLAIQTSECSSVHAVDSFFPLTSQTSNSRGTSQRSHSSRSTSDSKNRDKKIETIDFVEQANLNPTTYVNVGGNQQPSTLQDVSIKSGNGAFYYTDKNRNQRPGYRSQSNTYRSSSSPRSNSQHFSKTA